MHPSITSTFDKAKLIYENGKLIVLCFWIWKWFYMKVILSKQIFSIGESMHMIIYHTTVPIHIVQKTISPFILLSCKYQEHVISWGFFNTQLQGPAPNPESKYNIIPFIRTYYSSLDNNTFNKQVKQKFNYF